MLQIMFMAMFMLYRLMLVLMIVHLSFRVIRTVGMAVVLVGPMRVCVLSLLVVMPMDRFVKSHDPSMCYDSAIM